VVGNGQSDSHSLTGQEAVRIAEAFELPRHVVFADALLVAEWLTGEQALLDHLRHQHAWDASMAPYYVFWLRGDGDEPPV
jgi:hypothetical protein